MHVFFPQQRSHGKLERFSDNIAPRRLAPKSPASVQPPILNLISVNRRLFFLRALDVL